MSTSNPQYTLERGDPRQVIRWARRYAKSRTISFMVQWALIVCMVLGIWLAANLTHAAWLQRNMGLVLPSLAAMALFVLALAWISVSRWGTDFIWRVTLWLYGGEGYVEYTSDARGGSGRLIPLLGVGLVAYHLLGAILITFGYLPLRSMQPFSEACLVPFLVALILLQRLGGWAWIWPALYGLHAVLVLAGAPILLRGHLELLNMAVPVFGYGFIAILAGHLYSRFALWQLKRLTRSGLENASALQQVPE